MNSSSFSCVYAETLDEQLGNLLSQYGQEKLLPVTTNVPNLENRFFELGKALFFSKSLSGNEDVACASCHHPYLAGGDRLRLPVGESAVDSDLLGPGRVHDHVKSNDPEANNLPNLPRHSPTTFNVALYHRAMFHDGRVHVMGDQYAPNGTGLPHRTPDTNLWQADPYAGDNLLETQARFPVVAANEMQGFSFGQSKSNNGVRHELAERLLKEDNKRGGFWLQLFRDALGEPNAPAKEIITYKNIQKALAIYQASQLFVDNDWYAYVRGEKKRLTVEQKEGAILFFSERNKGGYDCVSCHTPPTFTDEKFHNLAVPQFGRGMQADGQDFGRRHVTQRDDDRYKFRTPFLLNIEKTEPYTHTGAFSTLESVISHHLDPEGSIQRYDFNFVKDNEINIDVEQAELAKLNTQKAYKYLVKNPKWSGRVKIDAEVKEDIGKIKSFLLALTDPCTESKACLEDWLPNYENYDQSLRLLQAKLGNPVFHKVTIDSDREPSKEGGVFYSKDITKNITKADSLNEIEKNANHTQFRVRHECKTTNKDSIKRDDDKQFQEVGLSQGLTTKHHVSWSMYTLENAQRAIFTGGIAVGDINNDCFPDIYLPTGDSSPDKVFVNKQGEKFFDVSHEWKIKEKEFSNGSSLVDIDGDDDLDLFVSNIYSPGASSIASQLSESVFKQSPTVYLNNNNRFEFAPEYTVPVSLTSWSFSFADVDHDGMLDMLTSHWRGPSVSGERSNHLWLQQDDSKQRFLAADKKKNLLKITGKNEFSFTGFFADFNNDNFIDIFMVSDFENSQYFTNEKQKGFKLKTPFSEINDQNGMGGALGDYDKDGDLDLFVTSIWDPNGIAEGAWGVKGNHLYENQNGKFIDVSEQANVAEGHWAWGACFADFDNDSWPDIFHANGFDMKPKMIKALGGPRVYGELKRTMSEFEKTTSRLFMANGNKTFTERAIELGITDKLSGRGVICVDYDRDGDVDILVSNHQDRPLLYENTFNDQKKSNSFINITLRSKTKNTRAIGAKIYVTSGGSTQLQQMQAGNSFLSSGPAELHFGLGEVRHIDKIKVVWPGKDGLETIIEKVKPNQFIEISQTLKVN